MNRYSKTSLSGGADAVLRVPRRQRAARRRAGGDGARRWPRSTAAAASSGRRVSRIASGCGRRATTRSTPRCALRPGSRGWTTDVCVPISRLAECVVDTKRDNASAPFPHLPRRPCRRRQFSPRLRARSRRAATELDEARRLNERMVERALAMGGTCTGEHGVGYGKMKFLEAEHGAGARASCGRSSGRSIPRTG